MFPRLFSKRSTPPIERYSYEIPQRVRSRIMNTLQQHGSGGWGAGSRYNFQTLLKEVEQQLCVRVGELRQPTEGYSHLNYPPAIVHFFCSPDDEVMDFIQLCFSANCMMCGHSHDARILVEKFNHIFEEEGIGYELTQPSTTRTIHGYYESVYPTVVRKDEVTVHQKVVKPALERLRDPRFATGNNELLDAFEKVQKGNYADAITSCCAAFESVMKTICDEKGWAYDPNKDTCSKLVGICKDNGLFFPFYAPILEGVGTVRNKIGDAHGKGPKPEYTASREHAEHMIAITCADIDFLIRQAGL